MGATLPMTIGRQRSAAAPQLSSRQNRGLSPSLDWTTGRAKGEPTIVPLSRRSSRHLARFSVFILLAACRGGSQDSAQAAAPPTLASPKLFPSTVATAPPRQGAASDEPAAAALSGSDLVGLFARQDLSRMSPDEASGHFASFTTLERATFPESLLLEGSMPAQKLTIAYSLEPNGSWRFASAQLVLRPAERTDSDAAYRDAERQLRKHFGSPKSVRQQGSMPSLIWKRPNRQELWLNQLKPEQAEGTWEVAIALGVSEEQKR